MKPKLITPELLKLISKYKEKYQIERNHVCLCGSGLKYKKCCLPCIEFNGIKPNYLKLAGECFDQGKYVDSERYFRAHLTQYLIWYNEHTIPLLKHAPVEVEELFSTDIEAIAELSASIARALYKQDKRTSIDRFLEYISVLIKNEKLNFYIDTQRALWLAYENKNGAAVKLLDRYAYDTVENIPTTSGGISALGTYLELKCFDIPSRISLKLVEKLLVAVDTSELKIDLLSRKARIAFLSNDEELATTTASILEKDMLAYEKIDKNAVKGLTEVLPNAYRTLAIVLRKDIYKQKMVELFKKRIAQNNENVVVIAESYYSMGQAYDMLRHYEQAIECFSKAINLENKPEYHLDLAKSYIGSAEYKKAEKVIHTIDYDKLKGSFRIDYLSYLADIALAKRDANLAIKTEKLLAGLKEQTPYFQVLISNYRGILLDFVSKRYSVDSLSYKIRHFLAKNLILQPNAFGIGINFNEILRPKEDDPYP